MRQRFYTSPVDHETLDDWADLATRLRRAGESACAAGARIETPDEPVFGYGTDIEETLLGLEDFRIEPRTVRIELWCAIVRYGAICITAGDGIVRKERRALEKGLQKVLRGETVIHESDGPFDRDERRIYGYRLDPNDDRDRSTLSSLTMSFDPPLYLAERWLLQGDDESIDEGWYTVGPGAPGPYVQFLAEHDEAEERVWQRAALGEGLFVIYDDDPCLGELLRSFSRTDDLRRLSRRHEHRVAIGRCRRDDRLVVVYDSQALPSEDAEWVFVI
ncbi:MAG: hypothetical protein MPN21_02670 [Thermoanaerobaculia bacterium]|nr:hypothetical protein [Thermoanaerobaculia bacterium]